MSRWSHKRKNNKVKNFMDGVSYKINPLDTLRIVASSSIFGEPSYYRDNGFKQSYLADEIGFLAGLVKSNSSTVEIFTKAVIKSLDYNFGETLKLAVRLRKEFNMRLNPAVIFVEAACHSCRQKFTEENPMAMAEAADDILIRPDDMKNMLDYYIHINHSKKNLPNVVKRAWARKLRSLNAYTAEKYKSKYLIDLVRLSHPKPTEVLKELMEKGSVEVKREDMTWEKLRSQGKSWKEILHTINIPHMALLRNLRGIFSEVDSRKTVVEVTEKLKAGVARGRQFPFRYYTAFNVISKADIRNKGLVSDALEECIDLAMANFPKLNGKVMCLSDNSGSAWGSLNSEYGSVKVADIGNLSSVMTAVNCDEGYVGVFGDRLKICPISKNKGVLDQHKLVNKTGRSVGMGTENGIWLFFDEAIRNNEKYDHIFIYSDMQAGHGGLFGENPKMYKQYIHKKGGAYIDVLKLVEKYRETVNSKVNIFSVQTAGYNNSVIPENLYRTAILSGWTGKEVLYAAEMNKFWDEKERG